MINSPEYHERAREIVRRRRARARLRRWLDPAIVVGLSLLVHLLLWLGFREASKWPLGGDERASRFTAPRALETRVLNPADMGPDLRRVVESESGKEIKNPLDRAAYRGERTQRVDKETVAAQSGSVAGSSRVGAPGSSSLASALPPREPKPPLRTQSPSEVAAKLGLSAGLSPKLLPAPERESLAPRRAEGAQGLGGTDAPATHSGRKDLRYGANEPLDSRVAIGARTLLNTDEYVYAGFFNRLTQEVRPRWEPLVQRIIDRAPKGIAAGTYQTLARFTMDDQGTIREVFIETSSGRSDLDEAARVALKQVLRLRNPPLALKEEDGLIRLKLGFTLYLDKNSIRMNYVPDPRLTEGSDSSP